MTDARGPVADMQVRVAMWPAEDDVEVGEEVDLFSVAPARTDDQGRYAGVLPLENIPPKYLMMRRVVDLDVWLGDMVSVSTGRRYDVVYLVFNTIFNLLTQDEQVASFVNAARHLSDAGAFVVEASVPRAWIGDGAYARPERVEAEAVTLDVCSYDPVTQVLDENHVRIAADGAVAWSSLSRPFVHRVLAPPGNCRRSVVGSWV